jgi:hypothetical protein
MGSGGIPGSSQGFGLWHRAGLLAVAGGFGLLMGVLPPPRAGFAQAPVTTIAPQVEAGRLSQPQLEQLLAPIALYPDELLMQVLMAASYPLEVVQAERWRGQNAALSGGALASALEGQRWDPSVKSLLPFPSVLEMMNSQLEWTQQLGDAVLAQQEDVLNAVQVLRGRAQAQGSLQTTPQQSVTVTQNVNVAPAAGSGAVAPPPQIITIAPAQPDQIFVPVYNPSVVFGGWPYPSYPPAYFPPPPGWGVGNAILTGMAFAASAAVVGSLWGWARPNWGGGYVNVDVNRFNTINVNAPRVTNNRWQHNVAHRGGVAYSNREVNNRFRGETAAVRDESRDRFRGRVDQPERGGGLGAGDRPTLGDRAPDRGTPGERRPGGGERADPGDRRPAGGERPDPSDRRPGASERPNPGERQPGGVRPAGGAERPNRPDVQPRPAAPHSPAGRPNVGSRPAQAPGALQGVGQGQDARTAAQRGAASRQAPRAAPPPRAQPVVANRPQGGAGGGARGGGGGGRGGGGPRR